MTTVAVTGASSLLGRALLERLDSDRGVDQIIGIDLAEPPMPVAKLTFRTADIRDRLLAHALRDADVLVHLAGTPAGAGGSDPWSTGPDRDEDTMFAINVHGTRNALEGAAKAGIRKLVILSSAGVYGAHPDNPVPLDESAPLRANPDFSWAYHKLLAEELIAEWAADHPDARVTVLRPVTMLGPGQDDFVTRHLESVRLLLVRGHEPPVQFVHTDDVAAAAHLAVTADLSGAYNVAADGWLSVSEVCAVLGRRPLVLPEAVAFSLVEWLWSVGLVATPTGALHYLMHPWVVSPSRLHDAGWFATRTHREILREFDAAHHEYVTVGRVRLRRRDVYAGAAAASSVALGLILVRRARKRAAGGDS